MSSPAARSISFSRRRISSKAKPTRTGTGNNRDEDEKVDGFYTLLTASVHKKYPLQSKEAASADWMPYGEWSFSFITPYELPAEVLHARVIDTDGYLYTFNTLDQTSPDPDSVNKWTDVTFGGSVHFNKVKKPPQYIVFCWDSYIDQKTYETSAVFGPETWQRMKTPASHTWHGDTVWYDNMTFGLSPEAKLKSGSRMSKDAPASP
jgi:hypothetical protein